MLSEPRLEQRAEQPYAALRRQVPLEQLGSVLPPLHGEVMQWLRKKGLSPAGAPFFRYLVMDMEENMFDVEVGWPIATYVAGDGGVSVGVFPAGRYGVILNTGPFDDLAGAHYALIEWGQAQGVVWQTADNGKAWGARIEFYITDPGEEPDSQKWQTEIAFLALEA